MALTHKQLGQNRPPSTSAVSIYSPAANTQAIIKTILVVVPTGTRVCKIYHDDDGSTYDDTTIIYHKSLTGPTVDPFDVTITMDDENGNLAVEADAADVVNFTVYGGEIT